MIRYTPDRPSKFPEDTGRLLPVSHFAFRDQSDDWRKEFQDQLRKKGWFYLIAYDAYAPPSVVQRLRRGEEMGAVEYVR